MSGGMDSTTLLYQLLKEGKEVYAISFNYEQKHKLELTKAIETCKKLGVPHKLVNMTFMRDVASNSSLTSDMKVPEGHYQAENMKQTVVPNRNMIMASIAIAYAVNLEADEIAMGVHAGDHAIYPDCRPEFIAILRAIAGVANYRPIDVYTPFLFKDKGDIAIRGKELGVDYSITHTCYNGTSVPCGKCGACQERKEAFEKAGIKDPLVV